MGHGPSKQTQRKFWTHAAKSSLLKMLVKSKIYSPNWWFNGDLQRYKVNNHLERIQANKELILCSLKM